MLFQCVCVYNPQAISCFSIDSDVTWLGPYLPQCIRSHYELIMHKAYTSGVKNSFMQPTASNKTCRDTCWGGSTAHNIEGSFRDKHIFVRFRARQNRWQKVDFGQFQTAHYLENCPLGGRKDDDSAHNPEHMELYIYIYIYIYIYTDTGHVTGSLCVALLLCPILILGLRGYIKLYIYINCGAYSDGAATFDLDIVGFCNFSATSWHNCCGALTCAATLSFFYALQRPRNYIYIYYIFCPTSSLAEVTLFALISVFR